MVTRVDAQLSAWKFGMRLKRDRLLGIISHDVLVHLCLREEISFFRVALQP